MSEHGTRASYVSGCGCPECVEANTRYHVQLRRRLSARPFSEEYAAWNCRCTECRRVRPDAARARRERAS